MVIIFNKDGKQMTQVLYKDGLWATIYILLGNEKIGSQDL